MYNVGSALTESHRELSGSAPLPIQRQPISTRAAWRASMARAPGEAITERRPKPGEVDASEDSKKPSHSLDDQTVPVSESTKKSTESATWRVEMD